MIEKTSFLNISEIHKLGFKSIGSNVLISRFASFYYPKNIDIGNNVRIDDYCIFSGNIKLGNYIHISAYSALYGKYGIEMEDFTGLSPRCTVFSASDDFSGNFMIGPLVPEEYTKKVKGEVTIKRFSQVGAGSIIMPGITLSEGVAIGALSLVRNDLKEWSIYAGNPLRFIKIREKELVKFYERMSNGE
jgi:galactoside O-acetyltransferase